LDTARLEAFLERLQSTTSVEELGLRAHELRDLARVSHIVYQTFRLNGELVGAFTYDVAWARRYLEKDYRTIDPVVLGGARRFHPIDWKLLDWSSPAARAFMREAATFGVGNQGWSIPIWGPQGEFAMFTVNHHASDEAWSAIIERHGKDFLVVSHLFHQQAKRIIANELTNPPAELSPRERETLSLLSLGQSRAEVADSLQISENTLRAYVDSARHKLGAMNVTHAVALALAKGVIHPTGVLPKY
jgi:DNA-binding CsgD family transcriptional regulator